MVDGRRGSPLSSESGSRTVDIGMLVWRRAVHGGRQAPAPPTGLPGPCTSRGLDCCPAGRPAAADSRAPSPPGGCDVFRAVDQPGDRAGSPRAAPHGARQSQWRLNRREAIVRAQETLWTQVALDRVSSGQDRVGVSGLGTDLAASFSRQGGNHLSSVASSVKCRDSFRPGGLPFHDRCFAFKWRAPSMCGAWRSSVVGGRRRGASGHVFRLTTPGSCSRSVWPNF